MTRPVIAALTVIVCALLGKDTQAATPVTFQWETRALVETGSSWNSAQLMPEGYGHFVVNGSAIPTRTVPGYHKAICMLYSGRRVCNNIYFNRFEAALSAPLGIMRVGSNAVHFTYGNIFPTLHWTYDDISTLGSFGRQKMFRISSIENSIDHWYGADDGSPDQYGRVDGDTIDPSQLNYTLSVTLEQLAPQLVADIKNFESALQHDQDALVANAAQVRNLAAQLANLEKLKLELTDLLARDLGEDLAAALDALLAKYAEVPPATREALVKVVLDLKNSIADMRSELSRITSDFRDQTDQVVGTVERPSAGNGWNPDDLSNYVTSIDPRNIPGINIPDTSTIPFDSAHDPYAAYATQIIEKLGKYIQGDDVVVRKDFLGIVRGWRDNQNALEDALRARGYPLQETNAFNAARNRVTDHLRRYIDGKDWFIDNPVPPETRDAIDRLMARRFMDLAPRLKEAMNEWRGTTLVGDQRLVIETVNGLAYGGDELDDSDIDTRPRIRAAIQGVIAGITSGLRLGVGVIPVGGDAMDMCEAITGYEFCTSTGRVLSRSERICSGLGVVLGSRQFWSAIGRGVGTATAVVAMAHIGRAADNLSDLTAAERKALLARIGHAIEYLSDIPGKEIKRLTDKFGEVKIMQVARVKGTGIQELEKMAFFEKNLNQKTRQAFESRGQAVKALPPLRGKTITEFRDTLLKAGFKKDIASDATQEIWLYKVAPNGSPARDGSVVRISLVGVKDADFPHFKKEISFNDDFAPADIACKLTDEGRPVPPGPNQARELLKQWFYQTVGETPGDGVNGPLETLVNFWGIATHIPFG